MEKTVVIQLPDFWQTLSWAPFNGGWKKSSCVFIHQKDKFKEGDLDQIFAEQIHSFSLPEQSVGLLTGARTEHYKEAFFSSEPFWVHVLATMGLSNARAAGDEADSLLPSKPDTINLIVATNALPDLAGNIEAIHTATMAKTAALMEAGIKSTKSGQPATGTGTDCIVICSSGEISENYCGMHTQVGELIGKAVKDVIRQSIGLWMKKNSGNY